MVPEDTPVPEEADNQGDTLFSFWNDLMSENFDEEGDGVLFALHRLQASITGTFLPYVCYSCLCYLMRLNNTGFEYRISKHPQSGKINAIFWTYPEQRFDLVTFGRVLFVDATHGTTHYD